MEHPLRFRSTRRRALYGLAQALLAAEQTVAVHEQLLRESFFAPPPGDELALLALRTHQWTSSRPQPRSHHLLDRLVADPLLQEWTTKFRLREVALIGLAVPMRALPDATGLPVLATVRDLADWLRLETDALFWYADLKNLNERAKNSLLRHYTHRFLPKADGSIRLLEIPKRQIKVVQRRILDDLLSTVPLLDAVHGFRKGRSIVSFAAPHTNRACVLRLDLRDFFVSIAGARVQALFRTLGYPEPVADLLGGLCTTTVPRTVWQEASLAVNEGNVRDARELYARPHLPQGAPTSPMLANLCAFRLDKRLHGLAQASGAVYTRYADDLAFSGEDDFARRANRFSHYVAAIVAEEGFAVQHRKTRLMRSSVCQHLAGLTVNTRVNVPRRALDRLEATLMNCLRHGPASQNRQQHAAFREQLAGKVAYAEMVGNARAMKLRTLLEQINWAR